MTLYIVDKQFTCNRTHVTVLPYNSTLFNWTPVQLDPFSPQLKCNSTPFDWTLEQLNLHLTRTRSTQLRCNLTPINWSLVWMRSVKFNPI